MARSTTWRRRVYAFESPVIVQALALVPINEGETLTRLRIRAVLNSALGNDPFALQSSLFVMGLYVYDNADPSENHDVTNPGSDEWLWWGGMRPETWAYDLTLTGDAISFERCVTVPEELDIKAQRGPAGPAGLTLYCQAAPLVASGDPDPSTQLQVACSALVLDPVA